MANQFGKSEVWIMPTSILLSGLTALYFFVLFPKDASDVFIQYLNYITLGLIVILALTLTGLLYGWQKDKRSQIDTKDLEKKYKVIEQIIWRNRYVLQSQKAKLMFDDNLENREQWQKDKAIFAIEKIFPKIPEDEVPFHLVSKLIEKSLSGSSLGGIRPPTYNVANADDLSVNDY